MSEILITARRMIARKRLCPSLLSVTVRSQSTALVFVIEINIDVAVIHAAFRRISCVFRIICLTPFRKFSTVMYLITDYKLYIFNCNESFVEN